MPAHGMTSPPHAGIRLAVSPPLMRPAGRNGNRVTKDTMSNDNALAHLTLENVIRLAKEIAAKHGLKESDAMDLAEFNLRYSDSYETAAARV